MASASKLKFLNSVQELNNQFLYRIARNVRNDSTIQLENKTFEVPLKYAKQKVNIRYDPTDFSRTYIFSEDGKLLDTIHEVKKVDNSKIKRNNSENRIDFSSFSPK